MRKPMPRRAETLEANPGADPATEEFPDRPDLVLIDGGLGQLGVAGRCCANSAFATWR